MDKAFGIVVKEKGIIVMPSREAFEKVVEYTDNYNDSELSVSKLSGIPIIWKENG